MVIINLSELIAISRDQLLKAGIENSRLDVSILIEDLLEISREYQLITEHLEIDNDKHQLYIQALQRRANREPLAYILGYKDFWKYRFKVTGNTLCPRPESEAFIEEILKLFLDKEQNLSILDIGTGSGCLAISLLKEYNNAQAICIDIDPKTIAIAIENAANLEVENRAFFVLSDFASSIKSEFDIIISNPPYVEEGTLEASPEIAFEPFRALYAGRDGLDAYHKILPSITDLVKDDGFALLEIGIDQKQNIAKICDQCNLSIINTVKDLSGIDRILVLKKDK